MSRDITYDRQQKLKISPPAEASVIGCGGVGAWIAIDLALTGVQKLRLFDDDTLEAHNLNRLPFSATDIGNKKTTVLYNFIKGIRPDIEIMQYGRVSSITKKLLSGVVIDCTDVIAAQQLIYDECKSRNMRYYRIGYDGHHITVIDGQHPDAPKVSKVWDDDSGRTGYTIISSWAAPPQLAASMLTYIICCKVPQSGPCVPIIGDIYEIIANHWEFQCMQREKK